MKNKRNNIIEDWLKEHGDPEISKQVEQEATELFKEAQKQHLIDMMQEDEELGLYDELEEAFEKWSETKSSYDKIDVLKFGAKWMQKQNDTSKVTRVEVIQHSPPYNGRAFTNYNAKDVEIQFQDDGKTVKIFLK